MDNIAVYLSRQHWDQVLNILGTTREHPWVVTNPLLMQIGEQLRQQAPAEPPRTDINKLTGNGPTKEAVR